MMGDLVHPVVVLGLRRQVAVHQEVRHFEVVGLLAELLDGDAPVLENPLLAANVANGTPAMRRVRETRIVGHQTEVVVVYLDLPEVHRTHGAVGDLHLVGLARAIVRNRQALGPVGLGLTILSRLRLVCQTLAPFVALAPRPPAPRRSLSPASVCRIITSAVAQRKRATVGARAAPAGNKRGPVEE